MDAKAFDEQVVRLDKIGDLADQFILARLERITGVDLGLFEFDYDLTWYGFFLGPDEQVYGRYGGRDAKSAEDRLSLAGLRFAMQAALDAHRAKPPAPVRSKPVLAEKYAAAQKIRKGECIHCHQVWEFRRHDLKTAGTLKREDLWVYPLPENLGIALETDQGNKVRTIAAGSEADKAGLRAGDVLLTLNGRPVHSFADAQHALHRAPDQGDIPVRWQRGGQPTDGALAVPAGWRKTNWTWRPSMLDVLPALSLYGDDLTAAEKKQLNLPEKRLAFRQDKTVHKEAQKMGVQAGDVIIGVDDAPLEMTMLQFLGYIRQTYLVGDKITLNVIRNGKRLDLPGKL